MQAPAQYTRISSPFGWRNCPFHGPELHPGIDIPAPAGTEIYASKAGTVETATYHSSLGNYIVIDHGDGTKSQYNHTLKMLVKKGDSVGQGQVILRKLQEAHFRMQQVLLLHCLQQNLLWQILKKMCLLRQCHRAAWA